MRRAPAGRRETLRDANLRRDREVARAPVRAACARLGVRVDATAEISRALADQATRALIEISESCERRDRRLSDAPPPAAATALSAAECAQALRRELQRAGGLSGHADATLVAFDMRRASKGTPTA